MFAVNNTKTNLRIFEDKEKVDSFYKNTFIEKELEGLVMIGIDFNKIFSKEKLIKIINKYNIYENMKYKNGLNINIEPFIPDYPCDYDFYFTCEKYQEYNTDMPAYKKREVIIPDRAIVQILDKKIKTNMIILRKLKKKK